MCTKKESPTLVCRALYIWLVKYLGYAIDPLSTEKRMGTDFFD